MNISRITPPRLQFSGKGNYIDLARFIGIACVIYGHCLPFNQPEDIMVRNVVYSFHMPLFFMISGLLEKPNGDFNWLKFKKTCYCLLLPYLIYNIPYISLLLTDCKGFIASILTASVPPNDPTWFFFALFMVKILMAILGKFRIWLLSLAFVAYCILEYSEIRLSTTFCVHATLTGVIFYEIGRLGRNIFESKYILLIVPLAFLLTYRSITQFGRYDMYWGNIDNPIWYLFTTAACSIAVLAFCKSTSNILPKHFKNNVLFPISRGTMVIVGTHYLFAHFANKMLFQEHDNLLAKWGYTILLLGVYWIFIEVTFKRFPVLYGKYKHHKES